MSYTNSNAGRYQNHYNVNDGPEYDPYNTHQPHQTYEQGVYEQYGGGYRDEPAAINIASTQPSKNTLETSQVPVTKENSSMFESEFSPRPGRGSARDLRRWRYDHQGQLWTKGGRGRCIGRFCFCTIFIALFLIISIILSLALWIRPPNIAINDVSVPSSGSAIQLQNGGLTINLGVNISVDNPNYFAVDVKKIQADIFYPINNTALGGGTENNINFKSHSQTNFTFPFSIVYTESLDPDNKILIDLATKCGFLGTTKQDITVNYKLTLSLRVLFITVSPVISNNFNFGCPLQESDIEKLLQGSGISIPSLLGGS